MLKTGGIQPDSKGGKVLASREAAVEPVDITFSRTGIKDQRSSRFVRNITPIDINNTRACILWNRILEAKNINGVGPLGSERKMIPAVKEI